MTITTRESGSRPVHENRDKHSPHPTFYQRDKNYLSINPGYEIAYWENNPLWPEGAELNHFMSNSAQHIEKLDIFIHLDEINGEQYAYLSIRPNSRILNPTAAAVKSEILVKMKQVIADSRIIHGLPETQELRKHIGIYLEGYQRQGGYRDYFTIRVASPTMPQRGADSYVEELIDLELKPGKITDEKSGKIDFHDLGFSDKLVKKNSKIAVLTHATAGVDGTTIYGDQIPAEAGKEVVKLVYDRKSITAEEQPEKNRTILKALITGFLYRDPVKGFFIDPDVLVRQVDFSTGNIAIKEFNQVATVIKVEGSNNILQDTVKPGFSLMAKEITVNGNVGRGAVLKGENIKISGIVDPGARITGNHISINKVVGAFIEGDDVQINAVVENATIIGRQVMVKTCITSTLKGSEVIIREAMHAGTVTAGSFIYCHGIFSNGKSVLRIDPMALPAYRQQEEEINLEMKKLSTKLDHFTPQVTKKVHLRSQLEKEISHLIQTIEQQKNRSLTDQQKAAIMQLISHGRIDELRERLQISITAIMAKRLKTYHLISQEIAELKISEDAIIKELSTIKQKLIELKLSYSQGLIVVNNAGEGDSQIEFATFSRPPAASSQTTFFSFNRQEQKILAGTTPFSWKPEDSRLAPLSPQALKIINQFSPAVKP